MYTLTLRESVSNGAFIQAYFNADFKRDFKFKNIVFRFSELKFREATIDDNKTYKLNGGAFGFAISYQIPTGVYEVIKNDDWFYCTKIN